MESVILLYREGCVRFISVCLKAGKRCIRFRKIGDIIHVIFPGDIECFPVDFHQILLIKDEIEFRLVRVGFRVMTRILLLFL